LKAICQLLALFALALALGCGKGDLNKDLKPVDPNMPRPEAAKGGAAPGAASQGPADEAPPFAR
jgi:hypothetical protein